MTQAIPIAILLVELLIDIFSELDLDVMSSPSVEGNAASKSQLSKYNIAACKSTKAAIVRGTPSATGDLIGFAKVHGYPAVQDATAVTV